MAELTEQEVQEMIQKAREGDAEANYRMSEWALEQAMAEPEEERWNRLAAKCLVKAAEAGYVPAQERMDALIHQLEEEKTIPETTLREAPASEPENTQRHVSEQPARKQGGGFSLGSVTDGASAFFGKAAGFFKDLIKKPQEGEEDEEPVAGRRESISQAQENRPATKRSGGIGAFFRFSEWDDAMWKKVQRVCLVICAVLVVIIIILLVRGRGGNDSEPAAEETPTIPAAATAEPVQPTATPEPVAAYPDEATRSAIEAAGLDVQPGDDDYVTEKTTATVSTAGSALYMRRGPDRNYSTIDGIPNGTQVEVYAYRGSWALVNYNGVYGWSSTTYLK